MACGRTLGHGENCVPGYLCGGCAEIERLKLQRDELLEALRHISLAEPDRLDHAEDVGRIERITSIARAAIAKGRGEGGMKERLSGYILPDDSVSVAREKAMNNLVNLIQDHGDELEALAPLFVDSMPLISALIYQTTATIHLLEELTE